MALALALTCASAACSDQIPGGPSATDGAGRQPPVREGTIVVHAERPGQPFDSRLLGTNLPAWLGPDSLSDVELIERTRELGTTVIRMPGGTWSNSYDWLGCENGDPDRCYWTWAARPTDYIDFLQATGTQGMWTVSANATAEEAAALVAFFNGEVADPRRIGRDHLGRDWGTVGDWAALRAEHGNPEPYPIMLWEVGNEVYAATADTGEECAEFGWEHVWTCDGTDYVHGLPGHDGYLAIRAAMRAIDPRIAVGAVGVADPDSWGDWGDEVLEATRGELDFYVVHHYAADAEPDVDEVLDVPRRTWPDVVATIEARGRALGGDRPVPVAVTEHNLVAIADADPEGLMQRAANAFYLVETIGQMATSGITIANQWNLANGAAANGTDYGLVEADTFAPSPAYHGLAVWRGFGDELLEVTVGFDESVLTAYAGRSEDGTIRLIIVNRSDRDVSAQVSLGADALVQTSARVLRAEHLRDTELEVVELGVGEAPPVPGPGQLPAWSITSVTIRPTP